MISATSAPLVVDLDGTLTPTDTLVESIISAVKQSPVNLLCLPFWLLSGKAGFRQSVARYANIDAQLLPYREDLLCYLREEKAKGRQIILATAANRSIADRVAKHLGLFDQVLASDATQNLKGKAMLHAIQDSIGKPFVYAGDSGADLPIWQEADAAVLVDVSLKTAAVVKRSKTVEREFHCENRGIAVWMRALRVHQWLKNLLLFVPLLTAFSFTDTGKLASITLAFLAFSIAASATYIANDLWDLENDRAHPRKRLRPFACARIPILSGLAVATVALLIACALAPSVSKGFFLILLLYLVLTSAYSWFLKRFVVIDVVTLSMLYTLRILAGSVAIKVVTSSWLLAFSVFIFLSLALVKRCAELVSVKESGALETKGRDYRVTDLVVLWPLGVGAAISAVVVFGLFISDPNTQARYRTPQMLWLVALGLIYWLARLWIKTSRGEMHDDPVVYAIKDRGSRMTVFAMVLVILAAHFLSFGFPQNN
jgi:4-hydroxybenzoate polyprenyltransferase